MPEALEAENPPAVPLWINGHAFLTLPPAFHDVKNPDNGTVIRRTPLCGPAEAMMAVDSARRSLDAWETASTEFRTGLARKLSDALATYATHFSRLIAEETGKSAVAADKEVARATEWLRTAQAGTVTGVIGIVGNASNPLLGTLLQATPIWLAGGATVILPAPQAPSSPLALAELSGRCDFPPGVISILHGSDRALEGLRVATAEALLFA